MRALLLHNPTSTTTTPAVLAKVTDALSHRYDLEVVATKQRGHAIHLAAGAVHDAVDVVFALGGDGTANEVVQSLAGTDVAFCPVPGGGTNVLARALGLPNDPVAAVEVALGLEGPRTITLGRAGDRWFTFIAGLGFDAAIVRRVEQRPQMKRWLRQLAFVWCGLAEWFHDGPGVPALVHVELPDGQRHGPHAVTIVGNADPYTFLGPRPLRVTPDADFALGLDVLAIRETSTPRILSILVRAFTSARHVDDPLVQSWHDLGELTLVSDRPLPLMVDGDYAGDHERVTFRAVPGALRVLA